MVLWRCQYRDPMVFVFEEVILWATFHCALGTSEDTTDMSVLGLSTCWGEMAILELAIDTALEGDIVELLGLCASAEL